MNRFTQTILAVLVCSNLAAVASGESIYLNRGPLTMYYNVLECRDAATSNVVATYATDNTYKRAGIGLSPDESILYSAAYSTGTELWSYNVSTGAKIGAVTVSSDQIVRGLAVDPVTGNIYCAMNDSTIAQITPGGTVTASWGTGVKVADIEVYNGKLYGATNSNYGAQGVYWWDLSSGGAATVLGGTGTTNCYALTFAPDGTLYTGYNYSTSVKKWDATYSSSTAIGSLSHSIYMVDLDYINGKLYAAGRTASGNYGEVGMIDPTTGDSSTWVSFTGGDFYLNWIVGETVPEPSTFALLAAGLIGLLAYAWRKRK